MAIIESIRQRDVTVYCTTWCGHSRRAKALLSQREIAFANIDIETDPAAAKQVEAWNHGNRSVPTILFHLIVTEPRDSDLATILLESQAKLVNLTAYITQWCPDVRRTMTWLKEHHIGCTTIDIDQDPIAAAKVREWNNGYQSVPTLDMTLRLTEPASEQMDAVLGFQS
jgi:glutaredoxin